MGMVADAGGHNPADPASDYQVKQWYQFNYDAVFRADDERLAKLVANMAIAAANNDNIIYIWGGTSYHDALRRANDDPAAITESCGTDCMGTVFANVKGAMRRLGLDGEGLPDVGTVNADALLGYGFTRYTDWEHTATDDYAERGDIYVNYSQHGTMHVGDGELDGYSTGSDSSSGGMKVNLNIDAMSPYVIRIPDNDTWYDIDKIKDSQVCGVALSAGSLFTENGHIKKNSYIAANLHAQAELAENARFPYALIAEVRAKSVAEAKAECDKLYYVCAAHIPRMSLWLHLDFDNSKDENHRILDYYIEQCGKWGFKQTLGIYVTQDELDRIDWGSYSDKLYLWKVDHTLDVDKYIGVIPFATVRKVSSGGHSGGNASGGSGQDYDSANDAQKRIVDACYSTPSPGAGWCAMWVSQVYSNAGMGYPYGNACDMYYQYCNSDNRADLKVGMIVATPSHPGDSAGMQYGHVGIYIGNNTVRQNVGSITEQNLDDWIAYYGKTHTVKWGWAGESIA